VSKDFREIGKRLSNWGRWGADDERGTVNYITPEAIVAAASLIKTGKVFDLELPLEQAAGGYRAMDERRAIKVLLRV